MNVAIPEIVTDGDKFLRATIVALLKSMDTVFTFHFATFFAILKSFSFVKRDLFFSKARATGMILVSSHVPTVSAWMVYIAILKSAIYEKNMHNFPKLLYQL